MSGGWHAALIPGREKNSAFESLVMFLLMQNFPRSSLVANLTLKCFCLLPRSRIFEITTVLCCIWGWGGWDKINILG